MSGGPAEIHIPYSLKALLIAIAIVFIGSGIFAYYLSSYLAIGYLNYVIVLILLIPHIFRVKPCTEYYERPTKSNFNLRSRPFSTIYRHLLSNLSIPAKIRVLFFNKFCNCRRYLRCAVAHIPPQQQLYINSEGSVPTRSSLRYSLLALPNSKLMEARPPNRSLRERKPAAEALWLRAQPYTARSGICPICDQGLGRKRSQMVLENWRRW